MSFMESTDAKEIKGLDERQNIDYSINIPIRVCVKEKEVIFEAAINLVCLIRTSDGLNFFCSFIYPTGYMAGKIKESNKLKL